MSEWRLRQWYDDQNEVHRLCEFLVECHHFTAKDLLGVLDKPWHFTEDYQQMRSLEPMPTRQEIAERNADDLLSSGYRRRGGCHETC